MRRFARLLALTSITILCSAHIGSPDAWYSGPAGRYHVLVHVQAPAVVPGIAVVSVKPDAVVETVTAFVNKFDAVAGGPPPDVATPVGNEPGWFRTGLWVMDPGSNSVTVSLRGAKGEGTVVVPLVAVAGRRLQFDSTLSVALVACALVLVAGLLTLVGATVREGVLPPGVEPDRVHHRRARFAMLKGAVVIVLVIAGLGAWWGAEDAEFSRSLFRPMAAVARAEPSKEAGNRLVLTITDSAWTERHDPRWQREHDVRDFTTLIADHQKLMHMFVIDEKGQTNFAHLHPTTTDSISFISVLPPLPAGRYRVFADVLDASGFAQTLATTVLLDTPGPGAGLSLPDPDDAWIAGHRTDSSATAVLADGATVTWLGASAPHIAGEEAGLRFSIAHPSDDSARLEPYLGMSGHAVVVRDDGAVFIHLHPMGTISVGAQTALAGSATKAHSMPITDVAGDTLYFPYAFPQPGNYTVWVQLKRHGRVLTCAFRATVSAAAMKRST